MNRDFKLTNGKTIAQVEEEMKQGIEQLYLDAWSKDVSVPYWDENRVLHLANPDGSDDLADFDPDTKKITVISRLAEPGQGRFDTYWQVKEMEQRKEFAVVAGTTIAYIF